MRKIIFGTSHIDANPQRYQDWIDYYTRYFHQCNVDLALFNDGIPAQTLNLQGVRLIDFEKHLGRESVWIFPGWKRSFSYALRWCRDNSYTRIGHIESDCFLTEQARDGYLKALESDGYYTGYTKAYNFPETSLQVINDCYIINFFLDKYSCEANIYENIDFEKNVLEGLSPCYILNGDRIEGIKERFNINYTFLSGTTLTEFKTLYAC